MINRYFCYDPDSGFASYPTLAGALQAARALIDEHPPEELWDEDRLNQICVGRITHSPVRTKITTRPASALLDADGYDAQGLCWAEPTIAYYCDYDISPFREE